MKKVTSSASYTQTMMKPLYNTLRKIPGVDATKAKEVVDDMASKNEVLLRRI